MELEELDRRWELMKADGNRSDSMEVGGVGKAMEPADGKEIDKYSWRS